MNKINKWFFVNVLRENMDVDFYTPGMLSIFYFAFSAVLAVESFLFGMVAMKCWEMFWFYVLVGGAAAIWFLVSALVETVKVIKSKNTVK